LRAPERREAFPFLCLSLFPGLRLCPFAFTTGFEADTVKFPPGACGTLPGTSNGAGFVNGP
jgi:hypothetical protein